MRKLLASLILLLVAGVASAGSNWYASPSGSGTACTFASPCTLITAQSGNAGGIVAGDTVWLRAGSYTRTVGGPAEFVFTISASGSGQFPLTFRNYPGERATLDGQAQGAGNSILQITGDYVWVWGLEFTNTGAACDVGRLCYDPGTNTNVNFGGPASLHTNSKGNRFIHCVVHDQVNGFGGAASTTQVGVEYYGNVMMANGFDAPPGTVTAFGVGGAGGSGYPAVTATSASGGGCAPVPVAQIVTNNGAVIAGWITNAGNCTSQPTCAIVNGGGSGATCTWFSSTAWAGHTTANGYAGIVINTPGTNYLSTNITRGAGDTTGTGAAGQLFTVSGGAITAIDATRPSSGSVGTGYNYCTTASTSTPPCVPVNPTCTIVSGSGSGATCTATAAAGEGGHGHGFYFQNRYGTINVEMNISTGNFRYAMQTYATDYVNGMTYSRNILCPDSPSQLLSGSTFIIGGTGLPIYGTVMKDNVTFAPTGTSSGLTIGNVGSALTGAVITNNYLVAGLDGSHYVLDGQLPVTSTITGNTVIGPFSANFAGGTFTAVYPTNSYVTSVPGVDVSFLYASKYQPGRGHLAIYKWAGGSSATINISSIVPTGYAYEIRNANNYYATPVVSATCSPCTAVSIPLTQTPYHALNAALGTADAGPLFAAFVILVPSLERVAGVQ